MESRGHAPKPRVETRSVREPPSHRRPSRRLRRAARRPGLPRSRVRRGAEEPRMNQEGRTDDHSSREARGPHPRTPRGPRQGLPRPTERRHPGHPRGVVVLNQFALPRSEGGGTRHIDLFGRLDAWEPLIVAANRNHATQRPFRTDDRRFHLVWVPEQHGGRLARVAGWVIYALEAFFITVTRRR